MFQWFSKTQLSVTASIQSHGKFNVCIWRTNQDSHELIAHEIFHTIICVNHLPYSLSEFVRILNQLKATYNLNNAPWIIALDGLLHESISELKNRDIPTSHDARIEYDTIVQGKPVYYTAKIPHALLFTYKLLAQQSRINLQEVTSTRRALLEQAISKKHAIYSEKDLQQYLKNCIKSNNEAHEKNTDLVMCTSLLVLGKNTYEQP